MTSLFHTSESTRLKASPGVRGVPAFFFPLAPGVDLQLDSRDAFCRYTNRFS
jgi:hypothetical protein